MTQPLSHERLQPARFAGRTVLVTGAASGIGKSTVERLLAEGAKVAAFDRNPLDADRLTNVTYAKEHLLPLIGDVTCEDDVNAAVERTVEQFGTLDSLFNNAGITGPTGPLTDHDLSQFEQVIAINLTGVWLTIKETAKIMRENGGGAIVNVASIGGVGSCSGLIGYGASKAAVVNMTKTAAVELARHQVRVNAICPGPVGTPLIRELEELRSPGNPEDGKRRILRSCPLQRYAAPAEIANVVTFLLSDEASYVTGAIVPVDGGVLAH